MRRTVALSYDIAAKIASFPYWHYEFDLAGHRTPIWGRPHRNRQEQRARYIFDPLLRLFGGSLSGKRVLDLGCNAGFWSLRAIQSGCDFVLGIDGRQMHVDQANFVFDVKEIDGSGYEFVEGDVYATDLTEKGPFEITLCRGQELGVLRTKESATPTALVVWGALVAAKGRG